MVHFHSPAIDRRHIWSAGILPYGAQASLPALTMERRHLACIFHPPCIEDIRPVQGTPSVVACIFIQPVDMLPVVIQPVGRLAFNQLSFNRLEGWGRWVQRLLDETDANLQTGCMPTGSLTTGCIPTGSMPTGRMKTGSMPTGCMPTFKS